MKDILMAKKGAPDTTSATTITTATTTATAHLLLKLLLETRRFPANAFKVTNPQSLSSLPPAFLYRFRNPTSHFLIPYQLLPKSPHSITLAIVLTYITFIAFFVLHFCIHLG